MNEGLRVRFVNPVLVVVTKSPADIVAAIFFTFGVETESVESRLKEVLLLEVAIVLIKPVLMPVPGVAVSCALR